VSYRKTASSLIVTTSCAVENSAKPGSGCTPIPTAWSARVFALVSVWHDTWTVCCPELPLRAAPISSAKSMGFPEDPSDSSSSDSGSDCSSGIGHRSSRPRLSSKRRRGHEHKGKILLKPISPSRYNGEPNANANTIQRFARKSKTYVMMGRVPDAQQEAAGP
jgi:hypothetical protein